MAPGKNRLLQDRAMRDAARGNLTNDVSFLKQDVKEKGVAARLLDLGKDNARTMADGARGLADDNRGKMAGGAALAVAGLAAWIFRKPIMAAIDDLLADMQGEAASFLGEPDDSVCIGSTDTDEMGASE